MKFDHSEATNIFRRVFTYTPRSEERPPLENFCTEALAWCIIYSVEFRKNFLNSIKAKLPAGSEVGQILREATASIRVDTQFPFVGEKEEVEEGGEELISDSARFDLILRPPTGHAFVIVIEAKVKVDAGLKDQLGTYRNILNKQKVWRDYKEKYVLSLTPWNKVPVNADAHLNWGEVQALIDGMQDKNLVLCQFSEFLHLKYLGNIKLMKITPTLSPSFEQTAQYFSRFNELFGQFRLQDNLKELFPQRSVSKPMLEYYEGEPNLWFHKLSFYTVSHDSGAKPHYYAGLFTKDGKLWLYLQLEKAGKFVVSNSKSSSSDVIETTKVTKKLFGENVFYWPEADSTSVLFCKELKDSMKSNDIIQWFESIAGEVLRLNEIT